MTLRQAKDLKGQLILAAIECAGGDPAKTFTFEELLVKAWAKDPLAWGLRGFEREHPDSERIHRELDSRGSAGRGLVQQGILAKVKPRIYRLTPKGIAFASQLEPSDGDSRERAGRYVGAEIRKILTHPVFREWLRDPSRPKNFREAGLFWGIAPGTPPRIIQDRMRQIDDNLSAALSLLDERGVTEIGDARGSPLFDREDIERCREFQRALKERFAAELRVLGATL